MVWLTPEKYHCIKWTGICIDSVLSLILAVLKFVLQLSIDNGENKSLLKSLTFLFVFLSETQLLVSVLLLIDSLRRLKKSFAQNKKYMENKAVMSAQIYVMVTHLVIQFGLIVYIDIASIRGQTKSIDYQTTLAVLKIALVLVVCSNQIILLYLLHQFSKPIV